MVPGIAMTPDPSKFKLMVSPNFDAVLIITTRTVLQARMFAYPDAQRYRLGVNYTHLPPNRAICPVYAPFERDGMGTFTRNYGGDPNYVRSSLTPGVPSQTVSDVRHTERIAHNVVLGQNEILVDDEDFIQPRDLWNKVFDETERRQWVSNVSETLEEVPDQLKDAVRDMFSKVDSRIGQLLDVKAKNNSRL